MQKQEKFARAGDLGLWRAQNRASSVEVDMQVAVARMDLT